MIGRTNARMGKPRAPAALVIRLDSDASAEEMAIKCDGQTWTMAPSDIEKTLSLYVSATVTVETQFAISTPEFSGCEQLSLGAFDASFKIIAAQADISIYTFHQ